MEEIKNKKIKSQGIILFGAFLLILILAISGIASQKNRDQSQAADGQLETGEQGNNTGDKLLQAVLQAVDETGDTMTLTATDTGEETTVDYTGGTVVLDKYNQPILPSQLMIGEIVNADFNEDGTKLVKLQISDKAWEYQNVNKWSLDTNNQIMDIAGTKYKYSSNLVVTGENKVISLFDLNEKDLLTIKGNEKDIYSIIVTKGHGTIQLEDYKDFVGGTAYIGDTEVLTIDKNMVITVREGTYELVLEHDKLVGQKTVDVPRDGNVVVNMGEFKKPPVKTGMVTFDIQPTGATLYIDNAQQSYASPVELEYGQHTIIASADGYNVYNGTLTVNEASKSVVIHLAQSQSTTETTGSSGLSGNTGDTAGNENGTSSGTNGSSGSNTTGGSNTNNASNGSNSNSSTGNNTTGNNNSGNNTSGNTQTSGQNYIYVQGPEGASVYFNAEFKGTAPVKFPKVTGTHYIILIKSGYQTKTYTINVNEDGEDVYLNYPNLIKE